jgi:hypothetical protein
MLLKIIKFSFVVVSIIVVGILIYSFYDHSFIFTTVYSDVNLESGCENDISLGDLLTLADSQYLVEVPNEAYDITSPTIFFQKIQERNCRIFVLQLKGSVFVNCIEVKKTIYTVDPSIINLLLRLNKIIINI